LPPAKSYTGKGSRKKRKVTTNNTWGKSGLQDECAVEKASGLTKERKFKRFRQKANGPPSYQPRFGGGGGERKGDRRKTVAERAKIGE